MSSPSAPLLELLRRLVRERGLNTASLAERAEIPRRHLRKLMDGSEPMLVDELLRLSQALDLQPDELGIGAHEEDGPAPLGVVPDLPAEGVLVQQWDNQPERLLQVAFELGCDFMFTASVEQLQDSGVPRSVLRAYEGRELPIRLEAAYHAYNEPSYDQHGVTLTLSFDAIYTCEFPWSSIRQVIFFPEAPAPKEPEEDVEPPKGPVLRLV
ncbi:MAG: helix-turn-helix domain-containing protein [Deltaproteobacteria bacterium]|nr:helix-turn-helix domain-containing protein [Deltaproteobacteria bacterium]